MARKTLKQQDESEPDIQSKPDLWKTDRKLAMYEAKKAYMATGKCAASAKAFGIPYRTLVKRVWGNDRTKLSWSKEREHLLEMLSSQYAASAAKTLEDLDETRRLAVQKLRQAMLNALSDTSSLRWDEIQKLGALIKDVQAMVRLEEGKATEIRESRHITNKEVLEALEDLNKVDDAGQQPAPEEVFN